MSLHSFPPQYRQIEQELRIRIASLHPGARLPSDSELCAEFGVSRMTARSAMQRLVDDGLVARRPGRGSFVVERPAHRQANRLMTFSQEMHRAGRVPASRVLARVIRPSTPQEAADLDITPRQPIVHVHRLRLADAAPVVIESAVLIADCASAVMSADLARGSLHDSLRREGFVPRRGTATIGAEPATSADARLLETRVGDSLLVERRVIIDEHGRRIEATESRYRADRYALLVRFDVDAPDPQDGPAVEPLRRDGAESSTG